MKPIAGGSPTQSHLAMSLEDSLVGPVSDGTTVYWAMNHDWSIGRKMEVYSAPFGGNPTSIAHGQRLGGKWFNAIAVDASNVYWLTESALVRIPK